MRAALGRRLHDLLLDRRLQRLRPHADRAGRLVNGRVRRLLAGHALAVARHVPALAAAAAPGLGGHRRAPPCSGWPAPRACCPTSLFSWAAGRVADRHRRDRIVLTTLHARIFLLAAMAVLLSHRTRRWPRWWPRPAAVAVPPRPTRPSRRRCPPRPGGPRRRARPTLLVTIEVASFVVGPALGGLLLAPQLRSLVPLLSLTGVATAAALVTGIVLPAPDRAAGGTSYGVLATLRSGPELRGAIGAVALVNAVLAAVAIALLPLAEEVWDGGDGVRPGHGGAGLRRTRGPGAGPHRTQRPGPRGDRTRRGGRLPAAHRAQPVAGLGRAAAGRRRRGRRAGRVRGDRDHPGPRTGPGAGLGAGGDRHGHGGCRDGGGLRGTGGGRRGGVAAGARRSRRAVPGRVPGHRGWAYAVSPPASPVVVPAQRRYASTAVGRVGNTRSGPIRSSSPEGARSSARSRLTRASATTMPR